MQTIYYGAFPFSQPQPLEAWLPLPLPGVYVVQVFDPTWRPWPMRPLYFGESGDLSERGFPRSHHAYERWVREAGDASRLWVSAHFMRSSSAEDRRTVESRLIAQYDPACNRPTLAQLMFRRSFEVQSPLATLARAFPPPSLRPVSLSSLAGLGWK